METIFMHWVELLTYRGKIHFIIPTFSKIEMKNYLKKESPTLLEYAKQWYQKNEQDFVQKAIENHQSTYLAEYLYLLNKDQQNEIISEYEEKFTVQYEKIEETNEKNQLYLWIDLKKEIEEVERWKREYIKGN